MLVGLRSMGVSAHSVTSSPSGTANSSSGTCVDAAHRRERRPALRRRSALGRPRPADRPAAAAARGPAGRRPPPASGRASGSPARSCVGAWAGLYTDPSFERQRNQLPRPRTECVSFSEVPMPDTPARSMTLRLVALGAMIAIAGVLAITASCWCSRLGPARSRRTRMPRVSAADTCPARRQAPRLARTSRGPRTRSMRQTPWWPGTNDGSHRASIAARGGRTSGACRPTSRPRC